MKRSALILLAVIAFLVCAPEAWAQSTRTSTAAGTFSLIGGVTGGTMTWDVNPVSGDSLNVDHDMEFVGDVTSIVALTCGAGVTLSFDGSAQEVTVTHTGTIDCDLQTNSVDFKPGYVQAPFLGRGTSLSLSNTEPTTAFRLPGVVIPCMRTDTVLPEPDCPSVGDGDAGEITLVFPEEIDNETGTPDDKATSDALEDIVVGMVGRFQDLTPNDNTTDPDTNAMYLVKEVTCDVSAADCLITLDINQGLEDDNSYPLVRRDVFQSTMEELAPQGQRYICVVEAVTGLGIVQDHDQTGRWARFVVDDIACDGDGVAGACEIEPVANRIVHTELTATDATCGATGMRIELLNPLHRTIADSAPVIFDYGWEPGNTINFYTAITFNGSNTGNVLLSGGGTASTAGTSHVEGAIFQNMVALTFVGDFDVWKNIWAVDCDGDNLSCIGFDADGPTDDWFLASYTLDGWNATTMEAAGTIEGIHGLTFNGVFGNMIWQDGVCRYLGDDCLVLSAGSGATNVGTVQRISGQGQGCHTSTACGTAGGGGGSMNLVDTTGESTTTLHVKDLESWDWTAGDASSSGVLAGGRFGSVSGMLSAGDRGQNSFDTINDVSPTDILITGNYHTGTSGTATLMPRICTRCGLGPVWAWGVTPNTNGNMLGTGSLGRWIDTFIYLGSFASPTGNFGWVGQGNVGGDSNFTFYNVLFDSIRTPTANSVIIYQGESGEAGNLTCTRCTIAERPSASGSNLFNSTLSTASGSTGTTGYIDSVVANFTDSGAAPGHLGTNSTIVNLVLADTSGNNIWYNNGTGAVPDTGQAASEANIPAATTRERDPGFINEIIGDFRPRPGGLADTLNSGIKGGKDAPGPNPSRWAFSKSRAVTGPGVTLRDASNGDSEACVWPGCIWPK